MRPSSFYVFAAFLVFAAGSVRVKSQEHIYTTPEVIRDWQKVPEANRYEVVIDELSRCPCWIGYNEDETEIRAGILRICENLTALDTPTLLKGIREYWEQRCRRTSGEGVQNAAKVHLLIRVIFDVPESYRLADLPDEELTALGEYLPQVHSGKVNLLWPLRKDAGGRLEFATFAQAFASGSFSPYNGSKDLKFMAEHFPRRPFREPPLTSNWIPSPRDLP